jgi:hypothetical protein
MNDLWKSPVLQGEENDYGDYDYLIEEVPNDSAEWTKWEYKCSECGKWHKWNKVYTHSFHTLDGYDSISTEVCWVCELKRFLFYPIKKFFKKIKKGVKDYIEYRKECKRLFKTINHPLAKHQKQFIKKIIKHK